jgi:hypothetical protein
MSSNVEYVKDPAYATEDGLHINCIVKFSTVDVELPFTASKNDVEPHGVAIYAAIISGVAGPIGAYVPPPAPSVPVQMVPESSAPVVI